MQLIDSVLNDISIISCAGILLFVMIALFSIQKEMKSLISILQRMLKQEDPQVETCLSCKKPVLKGAKFCHTCGKELVMVCSNCSSMMPLDARFCPGCKNRMWFDHKGEK
jgi:predicted amidophosphoribosyltransferase